jgi:predicted nucleic acid-binding Zn ribbon protein
MTSRARPSHKIKTVPSLADALGGRRREREIWANAAHKRILRKLNSASNSPSVSRVLWLLQALIRAENFRIRLYSAALTDPGKYDWAFGGFTDSDLREQSRQFDRLLSEIEKGLKRYQWTPTVRCGDVQLGLGVNYIWPKDSEESNWENWAVFWLIGQASRESGGSSQGLILRFRHCLQCGTWFYAVTEHQKFCTQRCRKNSHSSTPEAREKHRMDVREYRQRKKEMEKRQDEANGRAQTRERSRGR